MTTASSALRLHAALRALALAACASAMTALPAPAQTSGTSEDPPAASTSPNLLLVHSADRSSAIPGDVVTYTLVAQNAGDAVSTNIVLSSAVNGALAFRPESFGPGAAFQFVDGSPATGLSLGTPAYSGDGGATWTLVPMSGGGGAPPGADGRVTNWRLPVNGTMPAGRQFTVSYQATVR
jgi:uncharacterized repeat protein (TIGR01451 family)